MTDETLTYTLTGTDAAAAKLLDEVRDIFSGKFSNIEANDWRLEYYIMQVMSSPFAKHWEWRRSQIVEVVNAACRYDRPKAEWNTAFRRLTHRGFLYGSYTQPDIYGRKERSYGLKLNRYD